MSALFWSFSDGPLSNFDFGGLLKDTSIKKNLMKKKGIQDNATSKNIFLQCDVLCCLADLFL